MAALTSLLSMQTCPVPLPCFKPALPSCFVPKYTLPTSSPVSYKRVSRVQQPNFQNRHVVGGGDQAFFSQHSDKSFVVAIGPGIVYNPSLLKQTLQDISILSDFGLKFVLVPGVDQLVNMRLIQKGLSIGRNAEGLRATDQESLEITMQEVGKLSLQVQAILSFPGHLRVLTGNYIVAEKIKYFGEAGKVVGVDTAGVAYHLNGNHIVIVSQLGISDSREVIYCGFYDVATSCAVSLGAKKLLYVFDENLLDGSSLKIPIHLSQRASFAGVGVHSINGSVSGALLDFFERD